MTRNSRPRHGVRGEERRQEILRAALEVIAERGYRGATLGAVAERAGLTQQGLLHYFPTKEALLVGVLRDRDAWDAGGAAAHPREERVARSGEERAARPGEDGAAPGGEAGRWPLENLATLVEYNAMRPGIVRTFSALLGESITEEHPARDYFTVRYERTRAMIAASLRAEFGDALPGSGLRPEQAAPLLVAIMDGLQYQWLLDPDGVDMPALFRDFLALLGARERRS